MWNTLGVEGVFNYASLTGGRIYNLPNKSGTIALTSNLASYVPYAGATGDINIGNNSIYTDGGAKLWNNGIVEGTSFQFAGYVGSLQSIASTNKSWLLPDASGTIALTSDIPSVTGYVPYTGATNNVTLGSYDLTANSVNSTLFQLNSNYKLEFSAYGFVTLTNNSKTWQFNIGGDLEIPGDVIAGSYGGNRLSLASGAHLKSLRDGYIELNLGTGGTETARITLTDVGALGIGTTPSYGTSGQVLTSGGNSGIVSWSTVTPANITAVSPITSTGGPTAEISTSITTNKLVGRRSGTTTGVMEEITVGSGLTLTAAGVLNNTATPTGTGYFGAFQDMLTQTITNPNVGQPFLIRTVDESNQVSITANESGQLTRITPANTGTYNIQWSGQFQNPDNNIHNVNVWFRKGLTSSSGPGTDVVGSNGVIALPARKSAVTGEEGRTVSGWNFVLTIAAGEYVEFYWMSNSTLITLQAYPAGSPPPSTASLIVTVTQQAGIMAGTGITAINSLTGASQTLTTGTSGLDFSIISTGTSHTFNLPTASATNRGVLSSADWTTFNGKFNLPSLTSGSVLFSNGTTIAQDNSNFFWDDTNNRLGIGTNAPTVTLDVNGQTKINGLTQITGNATTALTLTSGGFSVSRAAISFIDIINATSGKSTFRLASDSANFTDSFYIRNATANTYPFLIFGGTSNVAIGYSSSATDNGGKLQIKAPGALSTDIALRVRNSADTFDLLRVNGVGGLNVTGTAVGTDTLFKLTNNGSSSFVGAFDVLSPSASNGSTFYYRFGKATTTNNTSSAEYFHTSDGSSSNRLSFNIGTSNISLLAGGNVGVGTTAPVASAKVQIDSTTQGFLPPRMTNAQRIAITTPAVGLCVYCTDVVEGLYINKSTGWTYIG